MVQNVLLGTLTTINLLVSPLSPGTLASHSTYRFDIRPHMLLSENCGQPKGTKRSQNRLEQNQLQLSIESFSGQIFTLGINADICTSSYGTRHDSFKLNLPIELLDQDFIENLRPNNGYVLTGIPSVQNTNKHVRLKITRLLNINITENLMALRVEWIPDRNNAVENQPLTIWVESPQGHATPTTDTLHARPSQLIWKRFEFTHRFPALAPTYTLNGELKTID
jgi:hypothetical protein